MKTCPPEEKLGAFLDGELSERDSAAVQAHVRSCKPCADAVAAIFELDRLTRSVGPPDVSQEEWTSTWTAIEARLSAPQRRVHAIMPRRRAAWIAAAAAALAIAAGALLLLDGRPVPPPTSLARECVAEEVEAGQGYAASVSYSEEGDATLITVSPVPPEEAHPNATSGDAL